MGTVATSALGFTVNDSVTPAALLTISGNSSNTTLVPNANIILAGNGTARTVQLKPAVGISGVTTITLTATDGGGLISTMSFSLTVNARPTITPIASQTVVVGTTIPTLSFTVGDDLTPLSLLTVTATSNNQSLVSDANIVLSGSGAARTITVTPWSGLTGSAIITVSVSDGSLAAVTAFTVTVQAKKIPR